MARAFAFVAEAGPFGHRVSPGPNAGAIEAALWACERAGLVMRSGRGWKLTPVGVTRRADMQALQTRRTG